MGFYIFTGSQYLQQPDAVDGPGSPGNTDNEYQNISPSRETPLHLGHLRNMVRLTEMGGIIVPPVPAFYHKPKTILDLVDHTVGKVLDLFDIKNDLFKRWSGLNKEDK